MIGACATLLKAVNDYREMQGKLNDTLGPELLFELKHCLDISYPDYSNSAAATSYSYIIHL